MFDVEYFQKEQCRRIYSARDGVSPFSEGLFVFLLLKEKEGMHCVAKERSRVEVDFVKVTSYSDEELLTLLDGACRKKCVYSQALRTSQLDKFYLGL